VATGVREKVAEGKDRERAASEGTKEITFAALAATLAVIAIFLPVIFMKGVIGKFFFQFGVTLSIAVMLSYFEAITLAPARGFQILDTSRENRSRVGRAADAAFSWLERSYERLLVRALRWPRTLLLVPQAVAGAVLGLSVSGKSLNLFSMIGILLLMGIVKKNSILLVEHANQVREHDPALDASEAMRKAGPLRLRPILMTTIATMMSAVPPILGLGPGTETRSPMAAAVLGGLAVSTVLGLVVAPAFYVVTDRAKLRLASMLTSRKVAPPVPPEEPIV
jgi:multidrug efflux pump subunit AcrB